MIKFSVVIPIYNAKDTLKRCVESVLGQTYQDIEVILVNDGSTDGSSEICDYYSKYDCIRVVNKVNGGLSSARNAGIAEATGYYLLFLDADDYLDQNVCEMLSKAAISGNYPDCLDFGIKYVNSKGTVFSRLNKLEKYSILNKNDVKQIIASLLCIKDDPNHFIWEFVWNKAYKLNIIKNNAVYFDTSRRIWEDKPFLLNYLRYCNTYYSVDNCFYYYVNTAGSLSQKYDVSFFDIILANYHFYQEWYENQFDFDTPYVNDYWCRSIEKMIFRSLEQNENKEVIEKKINSTLQNDLVQHWYSMRKPVNVDEKAINDLMEKKDIQAVVDYYKGWANKRLSQKNNQNRIMRRVLNLIRRVKKK